MARGMIGVELEGFDKLKRKLKRLPVEVRQKVIGEGLVEGAGVVRDEASRLAPRKTGALAAGIEVRRPTKRKGGATVKVALGKAVWYGKFAEYGTRFKAARPFLRPALDSRKDQVIKVLRDYLKDAVKRVGRSR